MVIPLLFYILFYIFIYPSTRRFRVPMNTDDLNLMNLRDWNSTGSVKTEKPKKQP